MPLPVRCFLSFFFFVFFSFCVSFIFSCYTDDMSVWKMVVLHRDALTSQMSLLAFWFQHSHVLLCSQRS